MNIEITDRKQFRRVLWAVGLGVAVLGGVIGFLLGVFVPR